MGIEPTRAVLPEPENKHFGAMANPKCDWRVNFGGTWGDVGMHYAATWRSTSQPLHASRTVRGTSCPPLA
jgi:hypothetical protein